MTDSIFSRYIAYLIFLIFSSIYVQQVCAQSEIHTTKDSAFSEEMETDRPDFTEGTKTIETGRIQFEGGYTYSHDDQDGIETESHSLPELLARFGLTDNSELRLAWEGYVKTKTDIDNNHQQADGLSDFDLGAKIRLAEDSNGWNVSSIFESSIPTGDNEISSDKYEPAVKLLLARDLNNSASVGSNINVACLAGSDERYYELSASATLGFSLCDSVGFYIEYFGFYPLEEVAETDLHYINGGLTFAITSNLQLDARVGGGMNSAADDLFTGFGVAYRM